MSSRRGRSSTAPCLKVVGAIFGLLFLIALLAVPVVTTTSTLRQDAGSSLVFRMTYPRNTTMFLPSYLARKGHPVGGGGINLRAAQWAGTMAVVTVLGIFDYFVVCRLLRRRAGRGFTETDPTDIGDKAPSDRSGFGLYS
jgi:hypothetical protein